MTYRTCALLCLFTLQLGAQHSIATYPVSVELRLPPEDAATQIRGELLSTVGSAPPARAWMAGGRIDFPDMPAGSYQLNILNARGALLKTLFVQATPDPAPVSIDLASVSPARPAGGSISIHALLHKTPPDVARLVEQALHSPGQPAVALLHQALAEDPECFEAHLSLGAALFRLKQVSAAAEEFQKAVRERPDSAIASSNLAAAYISLHRLGDAELAARRATAMNATLPEAHFLLAEALISEVLIAPDAEKQNQAATQLRLVVDTIPQARVLLDWTLQDHASRSKP